MSDALCWCASDQKCPHGTSYKIPAMIDDLEKTIDENLQFFDRKSIRRFLKKDVDGSTKNSNFTQFKDVSKLIHSLHFCKNQDSDVDLYLFL